MLLLSTIVPTAREALSDQSITAGFQCPHRVERRTVSINPAERECPIRSLLDDEKDVFSSCGNAPSDARVAVAIHLRRRLVNAFNKPGRGPNTFITLLVIKVRGAVSVAVAILNDLHSHVLLNIQRTFRVTYFFSIFRTRPLLARKRNCDKV